MIQFKFNNDHQNATLSVRDLAQQSIETTNHILFWRYDQMVLLCVVFLLSHPYNPKIYCAFEKCSQILKNFVQYFHEHSFHHMVHKQCKKPRDILSTIEEIIAATL